MIKKAEPPEFTSVAMKIPRDKETNRKPNKNKEHQKDPHSGNGRAMGRAPKVTANENQPKPGNAHDKARESRKLGLKGDANRIFFC